MIGKHIHMVMNRKKLINIFKLDCYPGSLCYTNNKQRNVNASCLASEGSKDISDDRIKTMHFIIDMNYKSLEHTNPQDGMNTLHHAIRRNPVS